MLRPHIQEAHLCMQSVLSASCYTRIGVMSVSPSLHFLMMFACSFRRNYDRNVHKLYFASLKQQEVSVKIEVALVNLSRWLVPGKASL